MTSSINMDSIDCLHVTYFIKNSSIDWETHNKRSRKIRSGLGHTDKAKIIMLFCFWTENSFCITYVKEPCFFNILGTINDYVWAQETQVSLKIRPQGNAELVIIKIINPVTVEESAGEVKGRDLHIHSPHIWKSKNSGPGSRNPVLTPQW